MRGLSFFVKAWHSVARRLVADCSVWLVALLCAAALPAEASAPAKLLVVGDSLSAEYGLAIGTKGRKSSPIYGGLMLLEPRP